MDEFYKMMNDLIIYWRKICGLFKVRLYFHFPWMQYYLQNLPMFRSVQGKL